VVDSATACRSGLLVYPTATELVPIKLLSAHPLQPGYLPTYVRHELSSDFADALDLTERHRVFAITCTALSLSLYTPLYRLNSVDETIVDLAGVPAVEGEPRWGFKWVSEDVELPGDFAFDTS
jgi:hypothetical protein